MECPTCGSEYDNLGQHWRWNDHRPEFTEHQHEVIKGLVMGDGCISNPDDSNPLLKVEMIAEQYLEYVSNIFGILGSEVEVIRTPEEGARQARESGMYEDAKAENYNTLYRWYTKAHPQLEQYADWYSSGEKVWPEQIKLTPTVMKHWYCGDGNYNGYTIQISIDNEEGNESKIDQIFESSGLPAPTYTKSEYSGFKAQFTVEQSHELWKYMGEPLPYFHYKWPEEYR